MDVRFLRSLVAVIETGSIAAAARRENRSAAAISQRVKALERTLGCTLLMRTAHAAWPSDQCLLLLPRIQAVIEQARQLQEHLSQDELSGEIKIGAISTALTGILPGLIERLTVSAPKLRLKITPGDSRSLYEKLLNQELDAAILVRPPFQPPKALSMALLRAEPLILIAPAEWGRSHWQPCWANARLSAMTLAPRVGRSPSAFSMSSPLSPRCYVSWMRWKLS